MNSKEIKTFLKSTLGITAPISVNTGQTKNPYISARVRPIASALAAGRLEYPVGSEISVAFRQCALAAVYGVGSSLSKQTFGGNVQSHSIAMQANEWRLAVSLFSRC